MPPDSSSQDVAVRKTIPPTSREIQAFIQGHLDRLRKERQAELDESRLLLSAVSPKVLEANGLALTRLGVLSTSIGIGGKRMVELHRPTAYHSDANLPPNAFRSGDVVAIVDEAAAGPAESTSKAGKGKASTTKGNKDAEPIDGVVIRVLDTKIIVAISQRRKGGSSDAAEEDPLPTRCRLVKVANEVTWERMENNLRRLAMKLDVPVRTSRGIRGGGLRNKQPETSGDDEEADDNSDDDDDAGRPPKPSQDSKSPSSTMPLPAPPEAIPHVPDLLRYLLGLSAPPPLPAQLDAPPLPLFNPSLNEPQRLALSRALTTRSLHLVHGPPGTGKTTLLVELVLQLVLGRGERVLVAGSSNLAVDNLGARLVAFATGAAGSGGGKASSKGISDLKCCRVGHPARILAGLQSHTLDHLATTSSSGELLSDVRSELQSTYSSLHPSPSSSSSASSSAGNKSTSRRGTSSLNSKRLTGNERRKAWEEVRELRKELRQRERGLFTQTIEDANVVLSTLHGAAGGVLERAMRKKTSPGGGSSGEGDAAAANPAKKQRRFDTIVIDEACQAIEASTWGAVLDTFDEENGGARLILAGDDRQLGPVVKSESSLGGRKKGAGEKKKGAGEKKGRKSKKAEKGKKDIDEHPRKSEELAEKADEALKIEESATDAGDDADGTGDDKESEDGDDSEDDEEDATALSTKPAEPSATNSQPSRPSRPSKLHPPRSLSQTLFTRLLRTYGSGSAIKSLLTVQYRMNEMIMEFPNKEMYEGQLVAHESCKDRWVGDGGVAGGWTPKGDGKEEEVVEGEGLVGGRVVFYDTAGAEMYESSGESSSPLRSTSKSNPHEITIISTHLSLLVHTHGFPTSSITLLAPYSAQVSALAAAFPASEWPGMEIGTIDALQGREQDVVIISLVRSSEETRGASNDDDDRVGFLAEERRLNVAMTRARRQLVVVGDSETIRAGGRGGYLQRWMDWLEERAVVEPVLPVT